jgi:15-cis-phytoene synthase
VKDDDAIEAAYAHCETVTREQAANFYYGIRLLSGQRRRAMCAVYAFARRVDDIGDGTLPRERKLALLEQQREALRRLASSDPRPAGDPEQGPEDPVMLALADARTRFPLPLDALEDLLDGVRMDLDGVRYESFEELVLYCRRVAGAIGRVCLAIFGLRHREGADPAAAAELADDLGVALQLTNILRDIREDAANGRVYLPAEDLRRFGLPAGELSSAAPALLGSIERAGAGAPHGGGGEDAALAGLIGMEAARAREWFERGIGLVGLLDRRSAACVLAMAGIYRRLLERIDAEPGQALAGRMSLPAREKAMVAVRGMLGAGR